MTAKQRMQRLEKTAPKPTIANPYAEMSDAELLDALKVMLESGEYIPEDTRRLAENVLQNNNIQWTMKGR
jgi:hypothetical protein